MPASLLLVDDDPMLIQVMARQLGDTGRIRYATSGEAALRVVRDERHDLILLDAELPGMNGFDTCCELKRMPELRDVPVIFVTAHQELELQVRGFAVGAADFIHKPVSEPILRARVATHLRLKRVTDELRHLANTDALTGLANKRAYDERLRLEWARALREHEPLCTLMVDVDHFKQFNDRYGHAAGDWCLRAVAQALQGALPRGTDFVARYGGEEFAVVLPNTTSEGGALVAQRLLQAVLAMRHPHERGVVDGIVSVSIGVACASPLDVCSGRPRAPDMPDTGPMDLMWRADRALYAAKHLGRARVRVADSHRPDAPPGPGTGRSAA